MRPDQRVAVAVQRWGVERVVTGCADMLRAGPDDVPDGVDRELTMELGQLSDPEWLAGGKPPGHAYWARVWAARALRYVWLDTAAPAVLTALGDQQWRVREMTVIVVADRELAEAADTLVALTADEVPRVRAAAARALGAVGEGEHADLLHALLADPEPLVVRASARALRVMSDRLDRNLR